ncbi:hypothetical protein DXC23_00875 [Eubacterium sp. OM08-24]|nr:hypothetical protein DXC23_00875 [Eubacterium sp. OM08-24]
MVCRTFGRETKYGKRYTFCPKLKVWSTFSKVVGVGNAHKYFQLSQISDIQTACRLVAEYNGESLCNSNKRKSNATITTNLSLFKGKLVTHKNFLRPLE